MSFSVMAQETPQVDVDLAELLRQTESVDTNNVMLIYKPRIITRQQTQEEKQPNLEQDIVIPLERVLEDNAQRRLEQEQLGGVDVGNGGGVIKEKFLSEGFDALEDLKGKFNSIFYFNDGLVLNLERLSDQLQSENIFVVDEVRHGRNALNFLVANGRIILKREYFESAHINSLDIRQTVLSLLLLAANVSDRDDLRSMELYSYLRAKTGIPLCSEMSDNLDMTEQTRRFDASESNLDNATSIALNSCSRAGFKECSIVDSTFSGFGPFRRYRVTASGVKMQLVEKDRCQEARKCLELFQVTPVGQITQEEYTRTENRVSSNCRMNN